MVNYSINEIYYTIQGEGRNTGLPVILVRFSGCNLKCAFCDTEHDISKEMKIDEIRDAVFKANPICRNILITGGEPLLQLDDFFLDYFKAAGYWIGIETNGTIKERYLGFVNWVSCSPKSPDGIVLRQDIDEVRVPVVPGMRLLPFLKIPARYHYLSPVFEGGKVVPEALGECLMFIKQNPIFSLSIQTHKLIGVR